MPVSLSIKNVSDELVERLRIRAKRNHRSVQGELLSILDETLKPRRGISIKELRRRVQALNLPEGGPTSREIIREERDAR